MKFNIKLGEYIYNEKTKKDEIHNDISFTIEEAICGRDILDKITEKRNEYVLDKYILNSIKEIEKDFPYLEKNDDILKIYNFVISKLSSFELPNMLNNSEISRFLDPFRESRIFLKFM